MLISTANVVAEQARGVSEHKEYSDYIVLPNIKPVKEEDQEATANGLVTVLTEAPKKLPEGPFVFRKPSTAPLPRHRFKVLQKFEGTVLEISGQECRALIRDLTSPGNVEEVTFSVEEISEADRSLAVPGGIFYWYIGYDDHVGGQRYRSSAIIFRRFPFWREKDLINAKKKAESLIEKLGWKREDPAHQR
jgi:hypothetical protein